MHKAKNVVYTYSNSQAIATLVFTEYNTGNGAVITCVPLLFATSLSISPIFCMVDEQQHVWQSRVELKHYSVAFSTALPRSKYCSMELPLRAGLIYAVKLHQCQVSLHSTYEPRP